MGRELGLVDDVRWAAFCRKRDAVAAEVERLKSTWVNPRMLLAESAKKQAEAVLGKAIEREYNLADLLRRPDVTYASLHTLVGESGQALAGTPVAEPEVAEQVEIQIKYAGYIARQHDEITRQVRGLSKEVQQKLNQHKPETIGQATRIQGITPAAVSLLLVHLKKRTLQVTQSQASAHHAGQAA